ncbi:hypothetical protein, variant [Exophiala oligosperma]|uniref:tRNA(His) guanylyltransferase n=1 Tax=Exophiala oligosperma TaxID=215243 RepID=A0A0D2DP83_9EURO|nr:hypothetical protein, variant [Exophiala oligosperma]KIW37664.1 hypothetical protein, variant [Exophiala oligosperma]
MANSKYEYVRNFERDEHLLPNTWIVVRIDGRGFHRFSDHYGFQKPNDVRALDVMNSAARHVVKTLPDIVMAYGVSDEYSFVFHKSTTLFERRNAKLVSTVVSTFTAAYVMFWPRGFFVSAVETETEREKGETKGKKKEMEQQQEQQERDLDVEMIPTFDARAVCYPSWENLRDYLSWRQVDCHINNLYNTTFWALVQRGGMSQTAAEESLKGTLASDKNEILWSRFGINYNNEPEMFRKGSVVFREYALETTTTKTNAGKTENENLPEDEKPVSVSKTQFEKMRKARQKAKIVTAHLDIIKDDFWLVRPWLRSGKPGRPVE